MKSGYSKSAMALALFLLIPATLPAGSVTLEDLVVSQDLAADLVYAYINADVPDSSSILTYTGSFDANGASGTFGGSYLGAPISGTLTETVEGDPTYNATTTTDSANNSNITLNAKMTSIGTTGVYTVAGTFGKYGALTGTASKSTIGSYIIYNGSVKDAKGDYYPFKFLYDTTTGDVTSIFGQSGYVDSGNVKPNGALGGTMNLSVSSVPEPPSLVLLGISAIGGLGYIGRRSGARVTSTLFRGLRHRLAADRRDQDRDRT